MNSVTALIRVAMGSMKGTVTRTDPTTEASY